MRRLVVFVVLSFICLAARDVFAEPRACDPDAGHRARDYVVQGQDARVAHDEWRRALDAGGAVAWTATLYDVDALSYFVMAFDRQGIRIYRMGQFTATGRTRLGAPEFPEPDDVEFSQAHGGCMDASVVPEAFVPWSGVRELKAGNWVLWFALDRPIALSSDRGKRKSVDTIKVNLHGGIGEVEYRWSWDPYRGVENLRGIGLGPAIYQERVRYTLVTLFDPAGRIRLPKQKRGAGW